MIERYGKKYGNLKGIKQDFYTQNSALLEERKEAAEIYKRQPLRAECKLCGKSLLSERREEFVSHDIGYRICPNCGHLNGIYEDTYDFSKFIYCGQDYGKDYSEDDRESYVKRMETIYLPKVRFLKEVLPSKRYSVLDIGAGSGYFCGAALSENMDIEGIEISDAQVKYGNFMIGKDVLRHIKPEDMAEELAQTNRSVVSAIGVLEHIYNLRQILSVIRNNRRIKYLYFSVPLFSLSVYLEMIFPEGFNRQLGGGHTHLFTMESIEYMNREFGFEAIAKWQFGTDIMDLYRFMLLRLENQGDKVRQGFSTKFLSCADELQCILDKADFCSEIHMLVEVRHE